MDVDINIADIIEIIETLPKRTVRDRSDPMKTFDEAEFFDRYRFSKNATLELLSQISNSLSIRSNKNNYIPPLLRLLTAMRFFATGQFQKSDGDLMGIHQSTVSRIVSEVSLAITSHKYQFVNFPESPSEILAAKEGFLLDGGFPNVIGIVDGSHIPIKSPGGDHAEVFRNRKGYFSINCQFCCNYNMEFTCISAQWPGSTHDCRVFDNSRLRLYMESSDSLILGDSGYACRRYLMTPVLNPSSRAEEKYNKALIKTRIKVERAFGILKQRFRCLRIPLRTKVETAMAIIVACACLHNFAIRRRQEIVLEELTLAQELGMNEGQNQASSQAGRVHREMIINRYFS